VANDWKIMSYWEQIEQVVHKTIIAYTAKGEVPTLNDIAEALCPGESWVKSAIVNNNEDVTTPHIIVTVNDGGYTYIVYYDSVTGRVIIKYLGQDEPDFPLVDNLPSLKARYEKNIAKIVANARHEGHGIARLELFYKNEKLENMTIMNPKQEEMFDVKDIGVGTYTVRAVSNLKTPSGKEIFIEQDVIVRNVTDKLKVPTIILDKPTPDGLNDWYITPVKVTIDKGTDNPVAKEIRYRILKDGIETTPPEDGALYTQPFTLNEVGTYVIYAWTQDEAGWSSEETLPVDVQFDNVRPEIDVNNTRLTSGTKNGSWLVTNGEITVVARDPEGVLAGYTYEVYDINDVKQSENKKITKTDVKIPIETDGEWKYLITAHDMAGNKSSSFPVEIHKDTVKPEIGTPRNKCRNRK
jgi:hypothetical protein